MFQNIKNIHLIGIGGIGLSGLAQFLQALGKNVHGCDTENSPWIETLRKKGINIAIGHDARHLSKKPDLVIYSLAIPKNHPELKKAKALKILTLSYPEALGILTRYYRTIAVAGTHGKTTVTAMIAKMFIDNNYDPNVILGTISPDLNNSNFRYGKSRLLIIEACEYKKGFLNFHPNTIVMTNIEHDHFDAYPKFSQYLSAFKKFSERLSKDGYLFLNSDDKNTKLVIKHLAQRKFPKYNLFTFGTDENSLFLLKGNKIFFDKKNEGALYLKIPGLHNRVNALSAYGVGRIFNMPPSDILYSLDQYEGSARRMELKGIIQGVRIYDDYAHHPTEIIASLNAVRELHPKAKICVVYQPHQYSRTKKLLKEFGKCFKKADFVIVPDIYEARDSEKIKKQVSAKSLVKELLKHKTKAFDGQGLTNTAKWLKEHLKEFQAVILMGAGDVWKIYEKLQ